MRCWLTLLIAIAQLFPSSLAAQGEAEDLPAFGATVEVAVINVDVQVTDGDGKPVTGLQAADFELYESGERVPISNFQAVFAGQRITEEEEGERAGPAASSPAPATHLAVYVDNVHISPQHRTRALLHLGVFLKERLAAGDRVMVASFGGTLQVLQGFTTEWDPLAAALGQLMRAATLGQEEELELRRTLESILYVNDANLALGAPCAPELATAAENHGRFLEQRVSAAVAALERFVDSLAGLPGRKALVYVSDGLPLAPGAEVFQFLADLCGGGGAALGLPEAFDAQSLGPGAYRADFASLDAQKYNAGNLFDALAAKANAARVTFYPLEATGPRPGMALSAEVGDRRLLSQRVDSVRQSNLQDPLTLLASETGGTALLNAADLDSALHGVGGLLDSYYSLGYSSPRRGDRRTRRLEVKVGRPGMRVSYRRSFEEKSLEEQLAERTMGTLLHGVGDNPLGVSLEIGELTSLDGSLFVVPLRLRIPLRGIVLLPEGEARRGRLRLHVGARDRQGRLAPVRSVQIPLEMQAGELEASQNRAFLYEVKMLMRAGDHSVAIGLRDELGATDSYLVARVPVAPP